MNLKNFLGTEFQQLDTKTLVEKKLPKTKASQFSDEERFDVFLSKLKDRNPSLHHRIVSLY